MHNQITKPTINFLPMQSEHTPLFLCWAEYEHIKSVWFQEGYHPVDYINKKVAGNGYDHPFIITIDEKPVGYIQYCDLYSYKLLCQNPKGLFINEKQGTFGIDLFIAEPEYLNKGYGTQIVKQFIQFVCQKERVKKIVIDPAIDNLRAIRCYEKAGFRKMRTAHDEVTECLVMEYHCLD